MIPIFDSNVLRNEPAANSPENLPDENEIRHAIEKKFSVMWQGFKQIPKEAIGAVAAGLHNAMITSEELPERVRAVCDGLLRLEKEHGDYGIKILSEGGIFVEIFLDACGGTERISFKDGSKAVTWEHMRDMLWAMKNVSLKATEFVKLEDLAPKESIERPFMPVNEAANATSGRNEQMEQVLAFMEKVPCSIAPYHNWKEFVMANVNGVEIAEKMTEGAGREDYGLIKIQKDYLYPDRNFPVVPEVLLVHEAAHRYADRSKNYLYTHTPEELKKAGVYVSVTPEVNLRTESFAIRATIQFLDDVKKNNRAHLDGATPDLPDGRFYFGNNAISDMLYCTWWQVNYLHECRKAAAPVAKPVKK